MFIKTVAIWGLVAISSAILAGVLAAYKRLDHSWWASWSFVFPPMLLVLLFVPRNKGPRPHRPTLDEQETAQGD